MVGNGRVAVLCPSRGRPDLLKRFWESAKHPLCDLHVWCDKHDPAFRAGYMGLGYGIHVGTNIGYARALNTLARRLSAFEHYSGYFTAEDDYVCINPRWPEIYLASLPADGVGLVADGTEEHFWPHTAMMGGSWVAGMGGLHPDVVEHFHLTQVWRDIAQLTAGTRVESCWEHRPEGTRSSGDSGPDYNAYCTWRDGGGPATCANLLKGIVWAP